MNDNVNHDPIDSQMDGEDRFPLMGRDVLSPQFIRLYAILIEKGPDWENKAATAYLRLTDVNRQRDPRPHKDKQHAWSARALADQMEQWRRLNMEGDVPTTRVVMAGEESWRPQPTIHEIKNARPQPEPEEAS